MIWFSSDFHFLHKNIAGEKVSQWKKGYRNFDSVEEMDQTLLKTINKYVKWDDTLYFLGDFSFGDHRKITNYRAQINCMTIHFIRGNHDKDIDKYKSFFSSLQDVLTITEHGKKIFLSHYAHRIWNKSHHGTIHLYGHSHGTIGDHGKSMDVGIDVAYRMFGEWRPFSIEEIIEIMDKKDIPVLDHHRANSARGLEDDK